MDVSTGIALLSALLAIATFFIGRQTASHSQGRETGSLITDLRYIKESVDRIERRLDSDISRLEGRIDEISNTAAKLGEVAGRAQESAKSAHSRMDEHLKREHGQQTFARARGDG